MKTYLRYYDERFGDVYEIYCDHEGNFISASRSLEAFGSDPIYYDRLQDIPMMHRTEINRLLEENQK